MALIIDRLRRAIRSRVLTCRTDDEDFCYRVEADLRKRRCRVVQNINQPSSLAALTASRTGVACATRQKLCTQRSRLPYSQGGACDDQSDGLCRIGRQVSRRFTARSPAHHGQRFELAISSSELSHKMTELQMEAHQHHGGASQPFETPPTSLVWALYKCNFKPWSGQPGAWTALGCFRPPLRQMPQSPGAGDCRALVLVRQAPV
jgi:hypothetical protein